MQLSKELIGRKLKSYTITVEKGKIREFCMAIGEKNPIFFDEDEARKAGYEGIPIPPTFQTTFQFWGYPEIFEDMRSMGIDTDRLLHMKEEYTYLRPIYANMTIKAEGEVVDVKTGKMEIVTFRTTYKNENDEPCIIAEMGIILRPKES
ncbi:MAG: MaoC family dehydratase N-terminal domain-containing protein [Leptospiraceae bacterium]|nr:MaoC family dehydratase N-terminal domain-containing protein [Leptospiraceae bacterium]MDW7975099.1 MaoC family dehydratase N-terminal domain-containing protein [Leptospiraceae bacterium]